MPDQEDQDHKLALERYEASRKAQILAQKRADDLAEATNQAQVALQRAHEAKIAAEPPPPPEPEAPAPPPLSAEQQAALDADLRALTERHEARLLDEEHHVMPRNDHRYHDGDVEHVVRAHLKRAHEAAGTE